MTSALAIILCGAVAGTPFGEGFTDQAKWIDAAGFSPVTLDFVTEGGLYEAVNEQYLPLAVRFMDWNDAQGFSSSCDDGGGCRGWFSLSEPPLSIRLRFSAPITALAIRVNGSPNFVLYSEETNEEIGVQVVSLPVIDGWNSFAGIIADEPFQEIVYISGVAGNGQINDLYIPPGLPPIKPADLNCDGTVDAEDLGEILAAYFTRGPGDLDGNLFVDGSDVALLIAEWLK